MKTKTKDGVMVINEENGKIIKHIKPPKRMKSDNQNKTIKMKPITPSAPTFETELESLINKYSIENGSDTPDFLIAEYMSNCLIAYQQVVTKRDKWFGVDMWAADKISAQRKAEDEQHKNFLKDNYEM